MKRIIFLSSTVVVILISIVFYFVAFGVPIHDIRMWMLKRAYSRVEHPRESVILADATYLGGPATHGSRRCNYVVGEVRSASLSKQKIREAYGLISLSGAFLKTSLPLTVLFFDDEWPNELPWFAWESDFALFEARSDTPYIVYGTQKNIPFLGDRRCDD